MAEEIKDYALKQVLAEILEEIHTLSGCQSVGIRLHNNGDYPYYLHEGFPKFFILKENSLCAKDSEGKAIRDKKGNVLLECMCGNVLEGRVDSERPYFTENGSFWTNSTTKLLDTVTEENLGRTRNMCHHSGYESVALIPVRVGDRTLGLIQMNDSRENMFTSETIKKYESLADYVGAAVFTALEIQKKMAAITDLVYKFKNTEN
jgi:GAF domain-containing protein